MHDLKKKKGGKKAAQLWEERISPGNIQGTVIWNESQRLKMYCRLVDVCVEGACEGHTLLWLWLRLGRMLASGFMTLPTQQHMMATLSSLLSVRGGEKCQIKWA